jgi:hypothetical protein
MTCMRSSLFTAWRKPSFSRCSGNSTVAVTERYGTVGDDFAKHEAPRCVP